jgi:hypothetical protein
MSRVWLAAAFLLGGLGIVLHSQSQEIPPIRVRAHLIDGSQVNGITRNESLKLKLDFSELTIPLTKVRRIEMKDKSNLARILLMNEDVLSGQIASESSPIEALFGKFELRWEHLKSLDILPPRASGAMPVRKGLVAYYSFDHGQEALGIDDASEKFHGEASGAKWIEKGKRGGAAEFDGNSTLTFAHDQGLDFTQSLTLSAWIHPNESDRSGYAMIIGKTAGSSWNGGYGLARMSGDQENVYFFVNNYSRTAVKAPVKSGDWSHVVGTFDGKMLRIYVNGKEIESLPASPHAKVRDLALLPKMGIQPVSAPLMFGSDQSGYFWRGKLDETALFDRALSSDEIRELFEAVEPFHQATKVSEAR